MQHKRFFSSLMLHMDSRSQWSSC